MVAAPAEQLLERDGTIYVLVREGSRGRLEELRARWGADEDRIVPVIGDLSQPKLGCEDQIKELKGEIDEFFHLAAIYDMTADAESQRVANVEGTREALQLAEALEAKRFHMVSSIAAAGLYKGTFTEDMFDEAEGLDDPYFRTKHDSEGLVRREYRPAVLAAFERLAHEFDLVILDPPAFVKRKKDFIEGRLAYRRINEAAMQLLGKDGVLVTCSCSYHMPRAALLEAINQGARHLDRQVQVLEQLQQAPDHPIVPAIAETDYLKGYITRVMLP